MTTHKPRFESVVPAVDGIVAVVDDDEGIEQALHTWLSMLGVDARSFHDGPSLLSALEPGPTGWVFRAAALSESPHGLQPQGQTPRQLEAVVIDLNLPGPNGFEVARQLRAHAPTLPVVVITAAAQDTLSMLGGVPPGVTCMGKPFDLEALEAVLFKH